MTDFSEKQIKNRRLAGKFKYGGLGWGNRRGEEKLSAEAATLEEDLDYESVDERLKRKKREKKKAKHKQRKQERALLEQREREALEEMDREFLDKQKRDKAEAEPAETLSAEDKEDEAKKEKAPEAAEMRDPLEFTFEPLEQMIWEGEKGRTTEKFASKAAEIRGTLNNKVYEDWLESDSDLELMDLRQQLHEAKEKKRLAAIELNEQGNRRDFNVAAELVEVLEKNTKACEKRRKDNQIKRKRLLTRPGGEVKLDSESDVSDQQIARRRMSIKKNAERSARKAKLLREITGIPFGSARRKEIEIELAKALIEKEAQLNRRKQALGRRGMPVHTSSSLEFEVMALAEALELAHTNQLESKEEEEECFDQGARQEKLRHRKVKWKSQKRRKYWEKERHRKLEQGHLLGVYSLVPHAIDGLTSPISVDGLSALILSTLSTDQSVLEQGLPDTASHCLGQTGPGECPTVCTIS